MNESLFDDLYNAAEYFRICNEYTQIQARYLNDISDANAKYYEMRGRKADPTPINGMFILPGVALLLIVLFMVLATGSMFGTGFFWIMIVVFLIVVPVLNTLRCKRVTKRYQKEADLWWQKEGGYIVAEDQQYYDKAQRELDAFIASNQHIPQILPPRYRNYTAALFMALAVGNYRADSLKEAINLYEEQCHRWEVEAVMQQTAQNIAAYNAQIEENLNNIYEQQARTHRALQNVENLEIYKMLSNS